MLSCKDITEKANDYLDGNLPFTTRLGMRMHIFMCVHCKRYVKQLHTTIRTLGLLNDDLELDKDYSKKLAEFFREQNNADGTADKP